MARPFRSTGRIVSVFRSAATAKARQREPLKRGSEKSEKRATVAKLVRLPRV
jgi:hypothetical protein